MSQHLMLSPSSSSEPKPWDSKKILSFFLDMTATPTNSNRNVMEITSDQVQLHAWSNQLTIWTVWFGLALVGLFYSVSCYRLWQSHYHLILFGQRYRVLYSGDVEDGEKNERNQEQDEDAFLVIYENASCYFSNSSCLTLILNFFRTFTWLSSILILFAPDFVYVVLATQFAKRVSLAIQSSTLSIELSSLKDSLKNMLLIVFLAGLLFKRILLAALSKGFRMAHNVITSVPSTGLNVEEKYARKSKQISRRASNIAVVFVLVILSLRIPVRFLSSDIKLIIQLICSCLVMVSNLVLGFFERGSQFMLHCKESDEKVTCSLDSSSQSPIGENESDVAEKDKRDGRQLFSDPWIVTSNRLVHVGSTTNSTNVDGNPTTVTVHKYVLDSAYLIYHELTTVDGSATTGDAPSGMEPKTTHQIFANIPHFTWTSETYKSTALLNQIPSLAVITFTSTPATVPESLVRQISHTLLNQCKNISSLDRTELI